MAGLQTYSAQIRRLMKQPKLTAIIQSCWLTLFGHIMHMDDNAKRILLASPPADWRRQPGNGHAHLDGASRGSTPSNRIWNNTTLHSPKQQIWLRTALCGGWCQRIALRNLRVACQKQRWRRRRITYYGTSSEVVSNNAFSVCVY